MDPVDNVGQVECTSDDRSDWECVIRSIPNRIPEGSTDFSINDIVETHIKGIHNFDIHDSFSMRVYLGGNPSISIDFGNIYQADGRCEVTSRNTLKCSLL